MSSADAPHVTTPGPAALTSVMFAVTGVTHLARPRTFDAIVPRMLPGPARAWTIGSGLIELALAGAVWNRRTRRGGGLASAVFLVAVFPANVRTVRLVRDRSARARAMAWARLPVQVPLVILALRAATDPR
ncbi:MauE/DoxX family redox-associated membrane protein [Occultella aeris]|uniref:Methylamine utilisation protein MauE domain-containing protein n=1 Tax=Occultella aeris TaxID=2761496 RepID=A0A7M4DM32_9MICO|nr:hypothetical protein [Occultella aeris]VZO38364.1 hypothetical protein HALOF300_03200 [Occultella aeris]